MNSFITPYQVPEELKPFAAWVVWGKNLSSDKQPFSPVTRRLDQGASVIDPNEWSDYETACRYAQEHRFSGLGFVLSRYDPFTFLDLDDPQGNAQIVEQQQAIFNNFPSYAEVSPSGRGLHIIVKGDIPRGRRRNKIEMYSSGRYMTVTGNAYRNVKILSCQEEIIKLYQQLGGDDRSIKILDEFHPELDEDETIFNRASSAANGEKFLDLWNGNWHQYYPDDVHPDDPNKGASKADFALLDILAFYTKSKAQITRMFHYSALGKRDKAKRRDYLEWMLNRCFDNALPAVDLSYLTDEIKMKIAEVNVECENEEITQTKTEKLKEIFMPPPGLLGMIAQFIYDQAPRPVREIALAGALGLMSGIVGRSYNVSSTGLNQYYLLLAPTGTGKESIASGIDKLMNQVRKVCPSATDFLGPGEIASPQALIKYMDAGNKSFVSILGEFGLIMKQMTMASAPAHLIGLRRILLDLYNKSGEGKVIRPTVYSNSEKNTKFINAPSVSLLGESTPERFYEILDDSMISEGLLPRFLNIEYRGDRPELNYNHAAVKPSQELIDGVAGLCASSQSLNSTDTTIEVSFTKEANETLYYFDKFCDEQINNTTAEIRKHLWNRAHIKVLKLASLVAIGINPDRPIIDEHCANWAKEIVVRDCVNIIQRFDSGEVGWKTDERTQIARVLDCMVTWTMSPFKALGRAAESQPKGHLYHSDHVVPFAYIQKKLMGLKCFKEDRLGPTYGIKKTLKTLIEMGEILEVDGPERRQKYQSTSPCYIIENRDLLVDTKRKGLMARIVED